MQMNYVDYMNIYFQVYTSFYIKKNKFILLLKN